MKKMLFVVMLALCACMNVAWAQNRTVSGTITS